MWRIHSNSDPHGSFPLLWPLRTPGDHNLYKLKYALCQDDFSRTLPHCVIISPLTRCGLIWTISNSLHPRMICTKLDWNWSACSGEDLFYTMVFPIMAPPDPKGPWFELKSTFFRKHSCKSELFGLSGCWDRFLNDPTPILWLFPLWRDRSCPLFEQFWILFTRGWFVPSLIKIGQLVLEVCFFSKYQLM
jgi:hypothetical protein